MNIITPVFAVTLTITSLVAANQATKPIDMPIHDTGTIKFETTEKLKPIETSKLEPKQIKPPKAIASPPASSSVKAEQVSKFSGKAVTGSKQDWMRQAGIPESDWQYVDYIVTKEATWDPNAINSSSGACSLAQALPCSKIKGNWRDPVVALKWQYDYVKARYGSYAGAHSFWLKNNWY